MLLTAHFKREAQKAKEQYYDFPEFFANLKTEIMVGKENIKTQYCLDYESHGITLHNIYCGYGMMFNGTLVTDQSDERIQQFFADVKEHRKNLEETGYKNNDNYKYRLIAKNNIHECTNSSDIISLSYGGIILFEQAILQAEQELIPATNNNKAESPQITIPTKILQALENERLITQNPLQWVGAKNLCAYFVDNYFRAITNKWETGKKLFGIENLAQLKDLL